MSSASVARSRPSLHNRMPPQEWEVRIDLAAAYRLADLQGWQENFKITNHFAARVPGEPDYFLIKPHELLFSEVRASDLVKTPIAGPMPENVNKPGFAIHSAVLGARPDLNASFHVHSEAGMALSGLDVGLKFFTQEAMRFYNRVSYHDFEGFAEIDEGPRIVRDLGKNDTMIMRNHGVLCCGATIESAALGLGSLIRVADVQLRMMATNAKMIEPSAEICENAAQNYQRVRQGRADWMGILRYVDRHDSSYRE